MTKSGDVQLLSIERIASAKFGRERFTEILPVNNCEILKNCCEVIANIFVLLFHGYLRYFIAASVKG